MKKSVLCVIVSVLWFYGCGGSQKITMESLLDEMVSVEEISRFPDPYYTCHQESSHDRRSVSPDEPGWFANNDGFGVVRVDTVGGRVEKVMFDQQGPGVITRIWITTIDKRGTWRFYFDGSTTPGWIIPAYDLMQIGIPSLGCGLLQPHTSYTPEGKGGNTLFLPIPYAKSCKITFEDGPGVEPTPKYYGINYRRYPAGTKIETFSAEVVERAAEKIALTDSLLLNPAVRPAVYTLKAEGMLAPGKELSIELPEGENAVYELKFKVAVDDSAQFGQLMRQIIFCVAFDGKKTVWVPLGDFSGGGMGAPAVQSWYLSSDGRGDIVSRWLMPYREGGVLKLVNISGSAVEASLEASVSPLKWTDRSLYFHCSWRQERGIYIHNNPDEAQRCKDWNFATIQGRGVYMGDLLSLFNHSPRWYGEGDEKIWVDGDAFPSHFGTGTEDYYNSSWAPVVPFHTPFGGAPRADLESSHGYNAFLRTRNLDGIPFKQQLKFDIEMIGWEPGYVDYATTVYWYGDYDSRAVGISGAAEAGQKLPAAPPNPADYKIEGVIEFETLPVAAKSPSLRPEKQGSSGFPGGQWSRAAHLLGPNGKPGDFIEFEFDNLDGKQYEMIIYATKANDYGIISFSVNGGPAVASLDGYNRTIEHTQIKLGKFAPMSGKLILRVEVTGTNDRSRGARYMFGLDCIKLVPVE